ncbi:unnamed protein product [Symbiodinium microadriaticum]|nr:unnamed protein product [Symbiodinium microadriaticum]
MATMEEQTTSRCEGLRTEVQEILARRGLENFEKASKMPGLERQSRSSAGPRLPREDCTQFVVKRDDEKTTSSVGFAVSFKIREMTFLVRIRHRPTPRLQHGGIQLEVAGLLNIAQQMMPLGKLRRSPTMEFRAETMKEKKSSEQADVKMVQARAMADAARVQAAASSSQAAKSAAQRILEEAETMSAEGGRSGSGSSEKKKTSKLVASVASVQVAAAEAALKSVGDKDLAPYEKTGSRPRTWVHLALQELDKSELIRSLEELSEAVGPRQALVSGMKAHAQNDIIRRISPFADEVAGRGRKALEHIEDENLIGGEMAENTPTWMLVS